ncbi:hypothetical protein ABB37_01838 [Leptomonas pyrrhocoris]|uniref:Uncharacterized protein n=1 Tax=Leptomonas pyrrhocoris TaxID=157538 RepID=A0A0M9G9S7_LEPPY|nr:hypothetical protein ABB37_01838 [Leptomonas pyrrhocoris]KPA85576.1 hypothetical protein ABB37_01838 [Leptomonas pyrrhocoris]|eukprot:XP_015664015.1 hypothetical protein ABB37_01838 [Leptomonas pyrrhocoris]
MSSSADNEVKRTAEGIATALWSPEELYNLDTQVDVLQPALKSLAVDSGRFYAYRLSLLLAPFEVLEELWAPNTMEKTRLKDDGTVNIRCEETRVEGRTDGSNRGTIAEQCKGGSLFRVFTTVAHRVFVVDRSATHVQTLVAALRYSFPQLLVPIESEPSEPMCTLLFEFVTQHWSALSAYLPLLYFLFEVQERAFGSFYKQLASLVQTRKGNDTAASDALRPKKGGKIFSWFSSKPKEAELGVNDKLELVNVHKATLPLRFEKRFMVALAKQEQMHKMQLFCRDFVASLQDEASTYQSVAECFTTSPMASEAVSGWYNQDLLEKATKDNTELRLMNTSVQRFAFRKSSLTNELLLPLLQEIAQVEGEIGILASSHVAYYEEVLMRTKTVTENTELMSGKVPLPQSCEASTRPESMANAREVNRRQTQELAQCRASFDGEVTAVESAMKARVKKLCVLVAGMLKALAACTEAGHFDDYLRGLVPPPSGELPLQGGRHPLKACLGIEDGEKESAFAVDRAGP